MNRSLEDFQRNESLKKVHDERVANIHFDSYLYLLDLANMLYSVEFNETYYKNIETFSGTKKDFEGIKKHFKANAFTTVFIDNLLEYVEQELDAGMHEIYENELMEVLITLLLYEYLELFEIETYLLFKEKRPIQVRNGHQHINDLERRRLAIVDTVRQK